MRKYANIEELSDEVLLCILSQLRVEDLLSVAVTCKKWAELMNDNFFWKKKCLENDISQTSSTWKEAFRKDFKINQNWKNKTHFRKQSMLVGEYFFCLKGDVIITEYECNLHVWSAANGEKLKTLVGHEAYVNKVTIIDNTIFSCADDGKLIIWDLETGRCKNILDEYWILIFDTYCQKVATGGPDGTIGVWNWTTGECLLVVNVECNITTLSYVGNMIASGLEDTRAVKLWDAETGKCLHTLRAEYPEDVE